MAQTTDAFGASKSASTLLVLFIPSHDRDSQSVDQTRWVDEALRLLGQTFGGATAYPRGRGVWRDDARGGILVFDEPVVVQCYTREESIEQQSAKLHDFFISMGTETKQGAVGFIIDRDYLEIDFPLEGA